ncbi:MAG: hypothetical protein JWO25_668 [Alphaproteobacteria bacterium]|nr:hypothetical protein [Alphaproteobacteria bacterium]
MSRTTRLAAALAAFVAMPAAAGAACSVQKVAELPVTMADGYRPMVNARINGVETRFIADSGAFYSLISPGVAAANGLKLHAAPPGFRLGGIGGGTSASLATVKEFTLAGVPIKDVQFLVGGTDTGTAGLIGQNVLGLADVEYDLPHGAIRLFRSHDCGDSSLAYWAAKDGIYWTIKIVPLRTAGFHTVGTVVVNGQKMRALFDTGVERTMLTRKAAERAGVKPGDPGVERAGFSRGLGREISNAWSAPFASVKIGKEEIHNVRLRIADTELGDNDMLLGSDFFISHRVYVDNASDRIFFSYTGGKIFGIAARRGERARALPLRRSPRPRPSPRMRKAIAAAARSSSRSATSRMRSRISPMRSRLRPRRPVSCCSVPRLICAAAAGRSALPISTARSTAIRPMFPRGSTVRNCDFRSGSARRRSPMPTPPPRRWSVRSTIG